MIGERRYIVRSKREDILELSKYVGEKTFESDQEDELWDEHIMIMLKLTLIVTAAPIMMLLSARVQL